MKQTKKLREQKGSAYRKKKRIRASSAAGIIITTLRMSLSITVEEGLHRADTHKKDERKTTKPLIRGTVKYTSTPKTQCVTEAKERRKEKQEPFQYTKQIIYVMISSADVSGTKKYIKGLLRTEVRSSF